MTQKLIRNNMSNSVLKFLFVLTIFVLNYLPIFSQKQNITSFYEGPFADVIAEAKKSNRPIFVDFSATWCKHCLKMEQEIFTNTAIASKLNSEFIAYKVDIDSPDGIAITKKYSVTEYPTYLIMEGKKNRIGYIKGYYQANQFMNEINKIMADPQIKVAANKKRLRIFSK